MPTIYPPSGCPFKFSPGQARAIYTLLSSAAAAAALSIWHVIPVSWHLNSRIRRRAPRRAHMGQIHIASQRNMIGPRGVQDERNNFNRVERIQRRLPVAHALVALVVGRRCAVLQLLLSISAYNADNFQYLALLAMPIYSPSGK